jgi:hypothetical protein
MSQEIFDPLIRMVRNGELKKEFSWGTFEIEGLPDLNMIWRDLNPGEQTRKEDYILTGDHWSPAAEGTVRVANGPRIFRPKGSNARRWYVGGTHCNYVDRTGHPDNPFGSLEEALKKIPPSAVGVVISKRTYEELHAFDPPHCDWNRDVNDTIPPEPVDCRTGQPPR